MPPRCPPFFPSHAALPKAPKVRSAIMAAKLAWPAKWALLDGCAAFHATVKRLGFPKSPAECLTAIFPC